jgi:hypothetical protein
MNRVNLDGLAESVRQFVLSLVDDPAGSVLVLHGRPIAWIVPVTLEAETIVPVADAPGKPGWPSTPRWPTGRGACPGAIPCIDCCNGRGTRGVAPRRTGNDRPEEVERGENRSRQRPRQDH